MIQSRNNKHIYYVFPGSLCEGESMVGGWYFADEAESLNGPYNTEKECIEKMNKYVSELYKGLENVTV